MKRPHSASMPADKVSKTPHELYNQTLQEARSGSTLRPQSALQRPRGSDIAALQAIPPMQSAAKTEKLSISTKRPKSASTMTSPKKAEETLKKEVSLSKITFLQDTTSLDYACENSVKPWPWSRLEALLNVKYLCLA